MQQLIICSFPACCKLFAIKHDISISWETICRAFQQKKNLKAIEVSSYFFPQSINRLSVKVERRKYWFWSDGGGRKKAWKPTLGLLMLCYCGVHIKSSGNYLSKKSYLHLPTTSFVGCSGKSCVLGINDLPGTPFLLTSRLSALRCCCCLAGSASSAFKCHQQTSFSLDILLDTWKYDPKPQVKTRWSIIKQVFFFFAVGQGFQDCANILTSLVMVLLFNYY